ncbi:cAMP-binding domain of CRP or a regulatory subunit of cAMP-dependent protein kinases [Filimonas lacunae]|uniref:cAMP-binding domain of CRP or a regulatory subunit of cAMP-dependent protein kinases n=1 Tax=Filimonas lacunae TaxID=477680 RepID=A0A173MB75_9BACT|nr:Crp/Fnr family transcriptional regulator [Filimonas lacunae]BAV04770.1 transcriptional regulator, Crp/Fnr family [Filimonas lacunae]SIT32118.1 cAMP-binding domain of CRP or a regulatory subunit of cAMP-dependent protein kinases [Filimonas lacunae]
MVDYELLIASGAVVRTFAKGAFIVKEGSIAKFFFQVVSGEVKMVNTGENGQEFIQGIFTAGQSFAEPPMFLQMKYPASAVAITDCEVVVLEKSRFIELLRANFDVQLQLVETLSQRLYFKSVMAREISLYDAGHRIITLIDFLKERDGFLKEVLYPVTLTRQQIADLTGLRVETVIRAIRFLADKELVQKGRKIYR